MDKMIPVKDVAGLARGENGVIHNVDKDAFNAFIANRERVLNEKERIANLENDVSQIKDSIGQILMLLQGK